MSSGEFDLISQYFAPLAGEGQPAYGLTDDAAVLSPPDGKDLVFTKDALVGDVHFFSHDPADLIAQKALRVNLSDLAGMGAEPVGYLLALALPKEMPDRDLWVETFASGLEKDQQEFDVLLMGGDTVSTTGPLTVTVTAIGAVKRGKALRRNGAQIGDDIYVSGTLGDSALGLKCLTGDIIPADKALIQNYHLPIPRMELGKRLHNVASAVMDISDGLAGDISHICRLSEVGAQISIDLIPISSAAGNILESFSQYKSLIWTGGDDYELLFTAPPKMANEVRQLSSELGLALTKIGQITERQGIIFVDSDGQELNQDNQGFRHF